MSIYTATIIFSLLVAVPIIILIYKTVTSVNKSSSHFNFDERITTTVGASGPKFHVKSMNVDYAKSNVQAKQATVTPIRAETLASAGRPLNVVAMKVPEIVNDEPARNPFNTKISASIF